MSVDELIEKTLAGEQQALARAISIIEDRTTDYPQLMAALYAAADSETLVVGITGSPGSGKSTIVNGLIDRLRDRGLSVGVLAVDPTSPFSGGSVLGDRVRMDHRTGDSAVFVRSMSAHGELGGLSAAATETIVAYAAAGFDVVLIETVGTGQNEIDIVRAADTVVLTVPPDSGDSVQTLKAGVLEIADLFAVNKADLDGAKRTVYQLQDMLQVGADAPGDTTDWDPPIVETVATEGDGLDELLEQLLAHRDYLERTEQVDVAVRNRAIYAIRNRITNTVDRRLQAALADQADLDTAAERVLDGGQDPQSIAVELLAELDLTDPE